MSCFFEAMGPANASGKMLGICFFTLGENTSRGQHQEGEKGVGWAFGKSKLDAAGKPIFEVYGKAKASGGAKQIVMIIRKGKADSDGVVVIPVANTDEAFGGGSFMFINESNFDVAGVIGDKKFLVSPGKTQTLEPQAAAAQQAANTVHAELVFRYGDVVKPFFSTTWPLNPKARCIIFFYQDPINNRLRFHSTRDFLP